MDRIIVEKLVVRANVGVTDVERAKPQRLRIDLELAADLAAAGETDELGKSVDYGAVVEALREVAATESPRLLEALAERMAQALLERYGPGPGRKGGQPGVVAGLKLRVVKLDPPLDDTLEAIGVEIERAARRRGAALSDRVGFR
jgi:dihydroneopterin aldolase